MQTGRFLWAYCNSAGCFHTASRKPWHGMSRSYGMTHSREIKSLCKNVRWQLLKHNKLSYNFSRNIFKKPFTNSSFFFFSFSTLWFLAPFATQPYTGKSNSVTTLIQVFWSTAFLPGTKVVDAFFPVSSLQPKKQWPWGAWLWYALWSSAHSPLITVFVIPDRTSLAKKWITFCWDH